MMTRAAQEAARTALKYLRLAVAETEGALESEDPLHRLAVAAANAREGSKYAQVAERFERSLG